MSEALARTREFDAFNRLTSYVIHDVKNSVSALSLLACNALTHFDAPEFQRDGIRTLSRTVERMKGPRPALHDLLDKHGVDTSAFR